ncbi:MAG: DUF167 domain-containing protein [Thaumarchaeota archaeon]|nr:DUF167 domain-containing protein [Nitrososphaerota archaeon]
MLIKIHATPNAKQVSVIKVSETSFEVKVDERAEGGRANKRLLEILSDYFKVPKSKISIVSGTKSRDKIVEVILEGTSNSSASSR